MTGLEPPSIVPLPARVPRSLTHASEQGRVRAVLLRHLRTVAPHAQYALCFVVADLLVSDQPPDLLLTVADALREAATELSFQGTVMREQVHSVRVLAQALAQEAPSRRTLTARPEI